MGRAQGLREQGFRAGGPPPPCTLSFSRGQGVEPCRRYSGEGQADLGLEPLLGHVLAG